jgi:hypothetical protein
MSARCSTWRDQAAEDFGGLGNGSASPSATVESQYGKESEMSDGDGQDDLDIAILVGAEVRRRNRAGGPREKGCISTSCEGDATALVVAAMRSCGFQISKTATRMAPDSAGPQRIEDILVEAVDDKFVLVLDDGETGWPAILDEHKAMELYRKLSLALRLTPPLE